MRKTTSGKKQGVAGGGGETRPTATVYLPDLTPLAHACNLLVGLGFWRTALRARAFRVPVVFVFVGVCVWRCDRRFCMPCVLAAVSSVHAWPCGMDSDRSGWPP